MYKDLNNPEISSFDRERAYFRYAHLEELITNQLPKVDIETGHVTGLTKLHDGYTFKINNKKYFYRNTNESSNFFPYNPYIVSVYNGGQYEDGTNILYIIKQERFERDVVVLMGSISEVT